MAKDLTRYDFRLTDSGDLYINSSGDFELVPSDFQHQQDCIICGPNWMKEYPENGVNLGIYEGGNVNIQSLSKSIQLQLLADGYNAKPIITFDSSGKLTINPNVAING